MSKKRERIAPQPERHMLARAKYATVSFSLGALSNLPVSELLSFLRVLPTSAAPRTVWGLVRVAGYKPSHRLAIVMMEIELGNTNSVRDGLWAMQAAMKTWEQFRTELDTQVFTIGVWTPGNIWEQWPKIIEAAERNAPIELAQLWVARVGAGIGMVKEYSTEVMKEQEDG